MAVRLIVMRRAAIRAFRRWLIPAVGWCLVVDVMVRLFFGYWLSLLGLASAIAVWTLGDLCWSVWGHARSRRRSDGT
jgi:hypothetical protein